MNDFLKQFFRTPSGSADRQDQPGPPNRDDEFIKEQFTTHQRLTSDIAMAEVMLKQAEELASALNMHALQYCKNLARDNPQAHLLVSDPARIAEPVHWLSKQQESKKGDGPTHFYRWKVTGNTHIFSVRASRGLIEFFEVPHNEVPHITMSEFGSRIPGQLHP